MLNLSPSSLKTRIVQRSILVEIEPFFYRLKKTNMNKFKSKPNRIICLVSQKANRKYFILPKTEHEIETQKVKK